EDFVDEEIVVLRSFPTQPKITVPTKSDERVIQLRTYNSPNYERNAAKEKMFDVRGELDLFRRCQMAPVFFGRALFGSMAPNVTYMLSFPNDDIRKKGWGEFGGSAEWKEMSGEEEFKNTATRIRNLFLKPSEKSQI
ncbi:MAG: NIPSNAP family protein, partial [Thermoguttaceae bacterium]|nr:NIPSNAP family protein [Thermoguttaceae bacterium]